MTTLRDALSDAMGQAEEGSLEAPIETPIESDIAPVPEGETQEQREARARDDRGRFAPKEVKDAALAAPPTPEPPAARKPPSSWKKDYWGHWERLGTDPELAKLQDYIEQREQDFTKGVSTYRGQWEQAKPVYEAIQPFQAEFQRLGVQPAQLVSNLVNAHRTLALGSPDQKLQAFAKLAMDYGVPLQAIQGQPDPQAGYVVQTVSAMQRELQQLQGERQRQQQQGLQQQIEAFKQNAPHFESVKETMAELLQSGMASDLKTAYDKAIRLNDDVWQQEQARQAQGSDARRQADIARKKAAAVSPRSSGPTGTVSQGNAKKGLRDQLSEALDSASTGRF